MATIHIRGKTRDGEYIHEIGFPDSLTANVVSAVVRAIHTVEPESGRAGDKSPSRPPRRKAKAKVSRKYMSDEEAQRVYEKVPTIEAARDYILGQPDRRHSLAEAAIALIGKSPKALSTNEMERKAFFKLQDHFATARIRIERDEKSGSFAKEETKFGESRVYKWKRH
jgi:hypothetical protein